MAKRIAFNYTMPYFMFVGRTRVLRNNLHLRVQVTIQDLRVQATKQDGNADLLENAINDICIGSVLLLCLFGSL